MPYDTSSLPATAPDSIRHTVNLLRGWFGRKFRHHLPPERDDQQAELDALLELMVQRCPADLRLLQALETDETSAASVFCVRQIERALAAAEAESDVHGHA
jgi:hypothetical protein